MFDFDRKVSPYNMVCISINTNLGIVFFYTVELIKFWEFDKPRCLSLTSLRSRSFPLLDVLVMSCLSPYHWLVSSFHLLHTSTWPLSSNNLLIPFCCQQQRTVPKALPLWPLVASRWEGECCPSLLVCIAGVAWTGPKASSLTPMLVADTAATHHPRRP